MELKQTWGSALLDLARKQGVSFIIMCIAVYVMYNRQLSLEQEIQLCNDEIVQYMKDQNEHLSDLLDRNNKALEALAANK